jgi:hypothetical protein
MLTMHSVVLFHENKYMSFSNFRVMATHLLQFWFDPADLPESARGSQEALEAFFTRGAGVTKASMAFREGPV